MVNEGHQLTMNGFWVTVRECAVPPVSPTAPSDHAQPGGPHISHFFKFRFCCRGRRQSVNRIIRYLLSFVRPLMISNEMTHENHLMRSGTFKTDTVDRKLRRVGLMTFALCTDTLSRGSGWDGRFMANDG
jgi:hypothetical protein